MSMNLKMYVNMQICTSMLNVRNKVLLLLLLGGAEVTETVPVK